MTRAPTPGDPTRVTNDAPGALPIAERHHGLAHWCQPLAYAIPGTLVDVCGYCGAPLERATPDGEWHYLRADVSFALAAAVRRVPEVRAAEKARIAA